ncbi:MAG: tetratricopeptide repeat protein, partial [Symploca sp. SIO1C4]|nr:tetratricopeptide repeat protein [Symploca sp. SIO1C4]
MTEQNYYSWREQGDRLRSLSRYEEAIACYQKALEIQPDDSYAWYWQGNLLSDLERYEQAIASYEKVLEIKP